MWHTFPPEYNLLKSTAHGSCHAPNHGQGVTIQLQIPMDPSCIKIPPNFFIPNPQDIFALNSNPPIPHNHWLVCCYGNGQQTISLGLVEVLSLRFPLSQNVMISLLPSQLKSHSFSECAIYMNHLAQEMTETSKLSTLTLQAPGGHN